MKTVTINDMAELLKRVFDHSGCSVSLDLELWHSRHMTQQKNALWKLSLVDETATSYHFPSYQAVEQWATDYLSQPVEAIVEEVENV